ncbi:hypothetical protein IBL28_21925 [Sinomicrobium sp. FJxs]|uniref:Uncharacterized protein n=2 Tax=Sinomicrobium weinanense TaxID=2842200 RepID=A0A926Q635_9FLAO|nr:hypothetical protein [Sinomicrobium weinanense]MBC9798640.1 hypothetical protein [Sinomicrobium weinanense]MBU3122804.1 hypothetical protein [Sinomicrobium weinanense]
MEKNNSGKYKKLLFGLLFDAIGYVSYIVPGYGEFVDVLWAPASAWLISRMYKGQTGKVAAVVSLIEELAPGLDVIPTFTLTWFYVYVFEKKRVVEVEENNP